jgi:PAS domain S-box-containing protein
MTSPLQGLMARPARDVMDHVRVATIATAADGRIAHVNGAFCRHFRTRAEDVVGLHTAEHVHEAERASFFEHWAAWERGEPRVFRMEIPDGAGKMALHLLLPSPIHDAAGRFRGVIVAFFPVGGATARVESPPEGLASLARSVLRDVATEVEAALRRAEPELESLRASVPALATLSEREWAVASRIARGDRTSMIASELGISPSTVRNHLKSIFRKTGARSQSALVERFQHWRSHS